MAASELEQDDPIITSCFGGNYNELAPRGPETERDTVASVKKIFTQGVPVYDIQVEGTCNFFAGEVLVHNCLLVDDPYKAAEEAASLTINEKVWRWWSQTASVRIDPDANVIVMFHRYHNDDFAGRLLEERLPNGKHWEYLRFPAIADENLDGSDPTGRKEGELLSPMRPRKTEEPL